MKRVLAVLAIVAAVAALFFRPPQDERGRPVPVSQSCGGRRADGDRFGSAAGAGDALLRPGIGGQTERGGLRAGDSTGPASLQPRRIIVYVAGEVAKPGVYALPAGSRAEAALARAGGAKPDADLVAVNLAEPLDDGVEVAVPKIGESMGRVRRPAGPRRRSKHGSRAHGRYRRAEAPPRAPSGIDLNTAGANELEAVPGIGPALAARIVEFRAVNGRFSSLDEVADVAGITPRLQAELAQYAIVR